MKNEMYCKANNPFLLNHPKRGDYEVLYDTFFELQDRLVAAEKPKELPEPVDNSELEALKEACLQLKADFNDALTLLHDAHDFIDDINNGIACAFDPSMAQPYRAFLEEHSVGVVRRPVEITKAAYKELPEEDRMSGLFSQSPSKEVVMKDIGCLSEEEISKILLKKL